MAKKKKRQKYVSRGTGDGIDSGICKTIRRERDYTVELGHKMAAWLKNRNPWLTVESDGGRTDQRYRRVRANEYWGNPKKEYRKEETA